MSFQITVFKEVMLLTSVATNISWDVRLHMLANSDQRSESTASIFEVPLSGMTSHRCRFSRGTFQI